MGGWVAVGVLFVGLLALEVNGCHEDGRSEGCRIVPTQHGEMGNMIQIERNNDDSDYDNDRHNDQEHMSVCVEWDAGEGFLFNQDTNVRRKLQVRIAQKQQ